MVGRKHFIEGALRGMEGHDAGLISLLTYERSIAQSEYTVLQMGTLLEPLLCVTYRQGNGAL